VHSYTLTLRPSGTDPANFIAIEEADVEMDDMTLDATVPLTTTRAGAPNVRLSRTVTAHNKGLLLREVSFTPLEDVTISLPQGGQVKPLLLSDPASKLTVRVQDLPSGSFYAARYAEQLASQPYLDTETLAWSMPALDDGVVFAYIASPFQNLRALLGPFLSLSSLGRWLIGLLGLAGGTVFSAFVQPNLVRVMQTKIGPAMMQRLKRQKK
jgi:hypothetical protein